MNPYEPSLQYKLIFDNMINGVYFVNRQRQITYWNKAAETISGYKAEEVIGKSCRDGILNHALGGHVICDLQCPLFDSMNKTTAGTPVELTLRHKNGYRIPVQVRCVPLVDADNKVIGAVEIFDHSASNEDVALKLKELGQIAYLDALTELPNRRYVEEAVNDWLTAFKQSNRNFAVGMADIDFFKSVNDRYGHDAGDLVLKAVAENLRSHLRALDIVGRWGGEEFILLLRNVVDPKTLFDKLDLLRRIIEKRPVIVEGSIPIQITLSFGGTLPRAEDTFASVVARADDLLYKSKHEGRNRVSVDL